MKKVLVFVFTLLLAINVSFAQTQQGVSYQYNGKKPRTPLGNVTISYDNNKRSVLSDAKSGMFSLTLEGFRMGDRIGLVTVKKREMMVFNQHAVDEWSMRKEPLALILCNADEFERQKANLIEIGKREARKKYDKQKAELETKLNASLMKQQEYEDALDKAYEELERFHKNVGEYADLFARIDESEVDTLAQRALDLFNCGNVDEAIRLFEQGHYMEKLDKALKNSQQADQLKAIAEQAKEQATQDSLKALQSLKAQIEAYKMNNEWNKAGELLKGLADRLNTISDCWAYAEFCYNQNNFKESEDYYYRAKSFLDKLEDKETQYYLYIKSALQHSLALLCYKTQRLTESEVMYNEALEIRRRLAKENPQAYESDVAVTLNFLATMYKNSHRFAESEKMYKEVLEIYRKLVSITPQTYESDMAAALNNFANLYWSTQRFAESEVMYNEAMEIRRRLAKENPQAYEPDVAATLNNLALLFSDTQRFAESEKMYQEALKLRQRLALANPLAYEPDVAQTLNNFANLYWSTQRFVESEAMYKKALEIRHRLAAANPQAYEPGLAMTLYNIANLYKNTQRFADSEKTYLEALEIFRRLAAVNLQAYGQNLTMTLNNLANLYFDTQRFVESEKMYQEALEIYRKLASINPQAYEPYLAMTCYGIGLLNNDLEDYAKSIPYFQEALEIYRRIAQVSPAQQQWYENSLSYLSESYGFAEDFLAAYHLNQEWLPIMKKRYEADTESLRSDYANNLGSQSFYCVFAKQYAEAEQNAREGLFIDSTQHWIASNLAAALLFQGKYDEAEKVYRQYKDELKDSFLDDFKQFAEAGVIPKKYEVDVERIKKILNE